MNKKQFFNNKDKINEQDSFKKNNITILVPTFNESGNINEVFRRVSNVLNNLSYKWEILFIDNCSTDSTRNEIEKLCSEEKNVKAIFNSNNFGFVRSQFYGLTQAEGDAVIVMAADLQDPPEVIPEFLKKWEAGYKVVIGVKRTSRENPFIFMVRKVYYALLSRISDIEHIRQFNGFGLYDKSFVEVLRKIRDPLPYLRGMVAEFAPKRTQVLYDQLRRNVGHTHFRFLTLYDVAMLGITSYSKVLMHLCTIVGGLLSVFCILYSVFVLICKLFSWNFFPPALASLQLGVFVLGSINLFFIGLVGEYIVNMNIRVMGHPLVIEEKRLNFK